MKRLFFVLSLFIPLFFISCNFGTKDPVQYTIIFDSNNENASGTTNSITADANTTVTLTTNAFVLSGYTFEGWNTKEDGTGTTYADNDSIELIEDLTLYAQWKIIKYTISFDGNAEDVSGTTESIQPEANKTITLPANGFSRTGYSFSSWNTASDGLGTSYAEGDSLKVTENLTLYAQWTLATVPTYEINIASAENGNISVSHSVAKAGTEISITLTPDEFYQFDSISVSDSVGANIETNSVSGNSIIYTFSMPAQKVTISAAFKQITYTVTFVSNNTAATGTTSSYSAGGGSIITLTQNGFSLLDYTFTGWNTVADGSGTGYEDEASLKLTDNLTLYAQWILDTIPTYSINTSPAQYGFITVNKNIAEAGTEIKVTLTANELYAIDAISIKAVDGSAITPTQIQGAANVYSFTMPEQNITVSATFKYIAHSITIEPMVNGSVTVNKTDAVLGEEITLTASPDEFYAVNSISIKTSDGTIITPTQKTGMSNVYAFSMLEQNVTVSVNYKYIAHSIIVSTPINGSITVDKSIAILDDVITLTVTPDNSYAISTIKLLDTKNNSINVVINQKNVNTYSFRMPDQDVTVSVIFENRVHSINISSVQNGTVRINKSSAIDGEEITVIATPNDLYAIDRITVVDSNNNSINFTSSQNGGNTYKFIMPASDTTINVSFIYIAHSITIANTQNGTVSTSSQAALSGSNVRIILSPNQYYLLNTIVVKDVNSMHSAPLARKNSASLTEI